MSDSDDVIIETDSDSDSDIEIPPPTPDVSPQQIKEKKCLNESEPSKQKEEKIEPPVKRPRGRPPKPIDLTPKKRKPLTQKQLDNLAKGRMKRDEARLERKTQKEKLADQKKKIREANIVKKATKIKKKEIMDEAIIMLSSEDEMDELEVKQVKRIIQKRKAAAKKKSKIKKEEPKPKPKPRQQNVIKTQEPPVQETPQFIFY
tara:strand:+ start:548 stop:1156 length:609 start_codon:yes stop_codon:yes gene_type:complete